MYFFISSNLFFQFYQSAVGGRAVMFILAWRDKIYEFIDWISALYWSNFLPTFRKKIFNVIVLFASSHLSKKLNGMEFNIFFSSFLLYALLCMCSSFKQSWAFLDAFVVILKLLSTLLNFSLPFCSSCASHSFYEK